MSFISELNRRNVFRVAVAYVVVAWLMIEVASVLGPALRLPDWSTTFVAFVLILGFPLALVLSWAYELTSDGMKKTESVPLTESITRTTGRKLDFVIIGVLVLAVGFMFVDNYLPQSGPFAGAEIDPASLQREPGAPESATPAAPEQAEPTVLRNSVAVLPLQNLSPDPNNAYFAAGIHEEILNQLAKLSNVNVISRTSVVRYADSDLSIPQIAAELNVQTVMEGSVRYANDRVLVTMQLIDPKTDAHLWSDSYNRDLADVFAIQADIAMNVANALRAEFSQAEQARIEAQPTSSPEAIAEYLKARAAAEYYDAFGHLDAATRLDPKFALAFATKALLYANILTGNAPDRQTEFERLAQENAERALALDPTLGEAHAALAFVHQAHWRWDEAEREFEQALRVSPNNADILSQYSRMKRYRGEYAAALDVARRAAELDPQNAGAQYFLGICYRYARDYAAAAKSFQTASRLAPGVGNFRAQLGFAQISLGNWAEAAAELQVAEQLYGDDIGSIRIPQLAVAYAQMGQRAKVEELFAALQDRAEDSPVNAALWAQMYIALEDYDQALEWLETAVDDEAPDLVPLGEIKANPFDNPVLEEPRFKVLRERIGT